MIFLKRFISVLFLYVGFFALILLAGWISDINPVELFELKAEGFDPFRLFVMLMAIGVFAMTIDNTIDIEKLQKDCKKLQEDNKKLHEALMEFTIFVDEKL